MSKEAEAIISCCVASLGLYLMDSDDLRIVKVVVFSRAVTNGASLLGSLTGLYKPVESSNDPRKFTAESFFALIASTYLCYAYVFETQHMPSGFRNSFTSASNMTMDEKMFFDAMRAIREIELRTN